MLYCIVGSNNQPLYVGRTKSPESRMQAHIKRFGAQSQMVDLEDDDRNEQEWIHYMRFIGADLANTCFKHSQIFKRPKTKRLQPLPNNIMAVKMPADKKAEAQALAEKRGMNISTLMRNLLYKELEAAK